MRSVMLFFAFFLICTPVVRAQEGGGERSSSKVTIAGETYYIHTVKAGDTFYTLSRLYDTDEETIRARNPFILDNLQPGQVLKILVKASGKPLTDRQKNKLFDIHTINQGETAYSISKRYGIALATLMEDNPGFDPAHLSIGQKVNIRIGSQGEATAPQIEQELDTYKKSLDQVSTQFSHHVVVKGETLYSLSKSTGIPIDTITKYNADELKDGLKLGSILKLPLPAGAALQRGVPAASTGAAGTAGMGAGVGAAAGTVAAPGGAFDLNPTPSQTAPVASPEAAAPTYGGWGASSPAGATRMKSVDVTAPIRVAVLLPLKVGGASDRRYLEFYQGVLLALDELKATGVSSQIDLFNTGRSEGEVRELLGEPALQRADLIIGPVYDDTFTIVADFAAGRGIPIVSPLAAVEHADNPLVFEVAPPQSAKYDKLKTEFSGANNVIVVSASSNDSDFQKEIAGLLPSSARRVSYAKGAFPVENWLDTDKENVFVVLSDNEQTTEAILASISSVQNARISRGLPPTAIKVVGSSRWARFQNLDKNLYFKLNLRYTTNYHADRGNERVAGFDRKYVASFSSLPSMYSYRGYDVAKLFVSALKLHGNEFTGYINDRELPLLQIPYRFSQAGRSRYSNGEWAKVCYNNNYTIDVQ